MVLVLLSVVAIAQKPKYIIVKNYREGKVTAQKRVELPTNTNTIYKTKTRTITKIKKVEVVKIEYKLVNVPTPPTALDTVSILQSYYPKNAFKDVLVLPEGQGRVTISDTISHNRLQSRKWIADIKPNTITKVVEVEAPFKRSWYLGPEVQVDMRGNSNWYGVTILGRVTKTEIIKLGTGVNMRSGDLGPSPFVSAGLYFKIK